MTEPIKPDAEGLRLVSIVTDGYDGTLHMGPFERPELGQWLTPEKLTEYDGFIVSHFGLLARTPGELVEFIRWCDAHGKTLISVDQDFQLHTPEGRKVADTLAELADTKMQIMDDERAREVAQILDGIVDLESIELPD